MKIVRVFPRRTKATPTDENAFVGFPSLFVEADEIHISVSFTWDIPLAEKLAEAWAAIAPVKMGGPALGMMGEDFTPGQYLKSGYVITSRGCPNKCWFCSVWKRDGEIRELEIKDGCNVQDDNFLACSREHILKVFEMLETEKKKGHEIEFTGGLEPKLFKAWHGPLFYKLKPRQMFFAYDLPDDRDPLFEAGKILRAVGYSKGSHRLRCYVLIGWKKDTFEKAESRLRESWQAGFLPMAMLWRDKKGQPDPEWKRFQRLWARPAIMAVRLKEKKGEK